MPKVLVIATSRKTRGGITSVIKVHEQGKQWKKYHCKWIGTHKDRSKLVKVLYFIRALMRYIVLLPFYDIVHIHFSLPSSAKRKLPFFRLAKHYKKKVIVHLHCGEQLPDIWSPIYKEMFTHSDLAIVLSNKIKGMIEKYIGTNHQIKILYNPCPQIQNSTPFEKRNKEILFAGTLNSNKGYSDLIKGFAIIAHKHSDWKLVFAGNGEIKQAEYISLECGIKPQCNFLGWVNGQQKDTTFRSASILCLPSYAEGFPMAVLDAWAYGIPVIIIFVGGITDVLVDRKNGLLFNPGDIEALSSQLDLLISDEVLRKQIAKESKNLADTTFNIDTINRELGDLYEKVLF